MIGKLLEPLAMLASEECKRAREEYGEKYSSPHEGFGILCEEVQEAEDEVKAVRRDLSYLLRAIRHGEPMDALISEVRMDALSGAAELLQVAAVCEKMMEVGI